MVRLYIGGLTRGFEVRARRDGNFEARSPYVCADLLIKQPSPPPRFLQASVLTDAFRPFGANKNTWVARNPPGFAYIVSEDSSARADEQIISS